MAAALQFPGVARVSLGSSKLGFACASARPGGQSCPWRRRGLSVRCQNQTGAVILKAEAAASAQDASVFTVVMKIGGSSLTSAERIRQVADLIPSFPEAKPVVVLSAMGKTTNNLLLAGEKAMTCGVQKACEIPELSIIKELHLSTIDELGLDRSIVTGLLDQLEQLLKEIAIMKELTLRTRDYLVSFGECMSTRIFAAYLNKIGMKARQYDAFDIGFITTDDFTNADILEVTYPNVAKRLHGDWMDDPAIPIVTGFLGKGIKSCAVTTLGRGGSDLTAVTIGKALGLREIQVWRDVDGVLTCDPNIYANVPPPPYLTFDEAAELAYFGAQVLHPQSMRPVREGGIPGRAKNSHLAPGTVFTKARDMRKVWKDVDGVLKFYPNIDENTKPVPVTFDEAAEPEVMHPQSTHPVRERDGRHAPGKIVRFPAPVVLGSGLLPTCVAARPGGASLRKKRCVVPCHKGSRSTTLKDNDATAEEQ
ncbi:hypothetical protein EJB05_03572, partial [Eragrostis curvula]